MKPDDKLFKLSNQLEKCAKDFLPKRVVVLEDDPVALERIQQCADSAGKKVGWVYTDNPVDFIKEIRKNSLLCVLTSHDIDGPHTGLEHALRLKAMDELDCPVFVMSERSLTEEECLLSETIDAKLLPKPSTLREVKKMISDMIEGCGECQQLRESS